MELDDLVVSKAIIERFSEKLLSYSQIDVAIVGAGPAGLMASYAIAKRGLKVAVFERRLSVGGGMWGGGMMFNEIVVQEEGKKILDELGVTSREYKAGYYTADSVQTITTLASYATKAGAQVFNLVSVEDIMVREERVVGLVVNWSAVDMAGLHIDPLSIKAETIIDATGHAAELVKILRQKLGAKLLTETGDIIGEKPMWADLGEKSIIKNTRQVYPGVYVVGMAANAVFGAHRMGPIFGGMLLSGLKVAELVAGNTQTSFGP
ncbi:MAG: sulfide-dependent adenosine diphosphate thiazole synthase [bacterium]|nr:sulfide-dependent adenosine diphosphate thiazole synthase [bacterium]